MSVENVIAFGKRAMEEAKLRDELMAAVENKDADNAAQAAAAIATRHGYEATPADVKEGYKVYLDMSMPSAGELSDTQLEAVAGGPGPGNKNAVSQWDHKKELGLGSK